MAVAHRHFYPYDRQLVLGRTDAGVDSANYHNGPIFAIAACVVRQIDPPGGSSWGGLGAVYFTLDHHADANGRSYGEWYTAEAGWFEPWLQVGAHAAAGVQVAFTRSGWQETGFYAGQDMNSQAPTLPGQDFRHFCMVQHARGHFAPGA